MIPGICAILSILQFCFDWAENKGERGNIFSLPVKEKDIGLQLLQGGGVSGLLFKGMAYPFYYNHVFLLTPLSQL